MPCQTVYSQLRLSASPLNGTTLSGQTSVDLTGYDKQLFIYCCTSVTDMTGLQLVVTLFRKMWKL